MGSMLPPADPRRQTYIPEKRGSASNLFQLPTVLPQSARIIKRSPGTSKLPAVDETSDAESWTPQKPWEREQKVERKTWESRKQLEPAVSATPNISGVESLQVEVGELSLEEAHDLSLSPKKVVVQDKKEPELSAVLAKLMSGSMSEPLNLSLKNNERMLDTPTPTPDLSKAEELVKDSPNLAPTTPARYMPRVSDISQATDVASPLPNLAIGSPVLAVPSLPLRDLRLQQLMQDEDETRGALDLSTGSVLADCSMAVHLTTPAKGREDDVDEELADVEEQAARSWEEEELEQLAMARATSAADDCGPALVEVEHSEWRVVEEQEICTTEVVEEVVEYEYQIVDGQRRLIGERKVGGSVTSQQEVIWKN